MPLKELFLNLSEKGTIVITPNTRLSLYLADICLSKFGKTGQRPISNKIFPIKTWIENIWLQLQELPEYKNKIYLTEFSQYLIWEELIKASSVAKDLFRLTDTIQAVFKAYNLACAWNLSVADLKSHCKYNLDQKIFVDWLEGYFSKLKSNNWLDFFNLISIIKLELNKIKLPNKIILYGFDDISPSYMLLLELLKKNGIKVIRFDYAVKSNIKINKIAAKDFHRELELAAGFIYQHTRQNSNKKLAIVIPQLEQYRDLVASTLEKNLPGIKFNISAPLPLVNYPQIAIIFDLLSLNANKINFSLISKILRSPYISIDNQSALTLLKLELYLRGLKLNSFSINFFKQKITDFIELNQDSATLSFVNLIKVLELLANYKYKQQSLDVWALFIKDILELCGWPGIRDLNQDEQELKQIFTDLLQQYSDLSFIAGKVNLAKAVDILRELALQTKFLPSKHKSSNIQVLGVLEACGMEFDAIWVTSLSNNIWPAEPAPSPFIPLSLQYKHSLPRSSAKRELAVAKNLTKTLINTVQAEIIFSYPEFIEEEPVIPSSLIKSYSKLSDESRENLEQNFAALSKLSGRLASNSETARETALDYQLDTVGPQLSANESLEQGTGILKLQAECAFKAFAKVRLKADSLLEPRATITKAEKGEIIHKILAGFWQEVKTLKNLQELEDSAIDDLLNKLIHAELSTLQQLQFNRMSDRYFILEQKRIFKMLKKFLQLELKREEFSVVAVEKTHLCTIGPLKIKIRVDRIDKVANEYVLLDYKTANVELGGWFGTRITEPQLPLYLVSSEYSYSACAFTIINPEDIKFKGIAKSDNILPKVSTLDTIRHNEKQATWEEQFIHWNNNLITVANDFYNAKADVNPKSKNISCAFCDLQPVCRINVN